MLEEGVDGAVLYHGLAFIIGDIIDRGGVAESQIDGWGSLLSPHAALSEHGEPNCAPFHAWSMPNG